MSYQFHIAYARPATCAAIWVAAILNSSSNAQDLARATETQTGKVWVMLELQKSANLGNLCLDIQEVRTWIYSEICFGSGLRLPFTTRKTDLDDGTYEGNLRSLSLPQGRYRIFNYTSLHFGTGTSYSSRFPFNAEFAVLADQNVYIGSWGGHATASIKSWFGLADTSSGSYLVLRDKFERDQVLWRKQNSDSTSRLINKSINAEEVDSVLIVQNPIPMVQPDPPAGTSGTVENSGPTSSPAQLDVIVPPANMRALVTMAAQLFPKTFGFEKLSQPSEKLQKWPLSPSQLDPAVIDAASKFADGFAGPSASSELFLKVESSYVFKGKDGNSRRGAFELNEVQVFYPNTQNVVTFGRTNFVKESPKNGKDVPEIISQELLVGGLIPIARTSKTHDSSMVVTKFEPTGTLRSPTFTVGYVVREHYGLDGVQSKDSYSHQSRVRLACEWFDFPTTPKVLVNFGTVRYLACNRYLAVSLDPKSAEVLMSRSTHAYLESSKVFIKFRESPSREQYNKQEIVHLEARN